MSITQDTDTLERITYAHRIRAYQQARLVRKWWVRQPTMLAADARWVMVLLLSA